MAREEKTYLELSEAGDGAHKFYEVVVQDKTLSIRFGRIGDSGTTSVTKFTTPDKARAAAALKIGEKTRKGYAKAIMGKRKKRPVTRRSTASQPSTAKRAPVLWKFNAGNSAALGIFIDDHHCWIGNQAGKVFCLDHQGKVLRQYKLPEGVKCIVADDVWIYAGCDDGNVYDLTRQVPRLAYQISEDVDIYWIDIFDGILGVSDAGGKVTTIDPEDNSLWAKQSSGHGGWMVRLDQRGVYHGTGGGVTAYDLDDGKKIWHQKSAPGILFGWQTDDTVQAGCGTSRIHLLDKSRGRELAVFKCDTSVVSNASTPDAKYIFGGDCASSIYCFNDKGKRLWKLGTGCGSALSMQFWKDRLYVVTTSGVLACLDASEQAIKAAEAGQLPKVREIAAPRTGAVEVSASVPTTRSAGKGVTLECIEDGGRLRMRVISPGYKKNWFVQFPKNIREKGARYVVDEVHASARGGFYRAFGEIKKLGATAPTRRPARARR